VLTDIILKIKTRGMNSMEIIYKAFDGVMFDDKFECERHEFKNKYPQLDKIEFYDELNYPIDKIDTDYAYDNVMKVIVHNTDEVVALQAFSSFYGYPAYEDITNVGTWIYSEFFDAFVVLESKEVKVGSKIQLIKEMDGFEDIGKVCEVLYITDSDVVVFSIDSLLGWCKKDEIENYFKVVE
jgi:hypothetical protein